MKRSLPALLIVLSASLLSACGFHLRGSDDGSRFAVKEISLKTDSPYSELSRDVLRMLEQDGVQVTTGAPWRLVLGAPVESSRATSYTPNSRGAEYELTRSLPFEIRSSDNLLLQRDTLEVQRTLVKDESSVLASDVEGERLRREMQDELVRLLALRLQRLDAQRLQQLAERARAAHAAPAR